MASDEFISLEAPCEADVKDEGGDVQVEAPDVNGAEPLASELQPDGEADAKDEGGGVQVEAPHVNGAEPLASELQPDGEAGVVASNPEPSAGNLDLEEGQLEDMDLAEPLASELQPDGEAGVVASNPEPSAENLDLEEGQLEDMDLADDDVVVGKDQLLDASIQPQTTVRAAVQTVIGFEVKLDKGDGTENAPIYESNSISVEESPSRGVKRARVESKEPSVRVIYSDLTRESKRKLMQLMQQWSEWQARRQHHLKEAVEGTLESGEETYYPALHVGSEKSYAVSFWVDNQAKESDTVYDDSVPLYDREFTWGSTPLGDSSNTERADKEDSRCFNCGSYSHALKDCPKPRDNVAISNARKQHNLKRNQSNVNRVQNRYYQKTPGKFDDLKAGVLGPETRQCLGIGENDPPPWLHRMRELGYPLGYLDVVEDEDKPSGITIFGDGEVKLDFEEGELSEQGEASPPKIRMTVEFPGINAPIPENGDQWLWGSAPPQSSGRHHSLDSRDYRDRGPPGADHYSSRHHSQDYGPMSPSLGRSHSDRGWRSPPRYDNLPADDGAWTPHSYPSRQYSGHYSSSSDMSSRHSRDRDRDRHDSRHYHHRR